MKSINNLSLEQLIHNYPFYNADLFQKFYTAYEQRKLFVEKLEVERPDLIEEENPFLLTNDKLENLNRMAQSRHSMFSDIGHKNLQKLKPTKTLIDGASSDTIYVLFCPFRVMAADVFGYVLDLYPDGFRLYSQKEAERNASQFFQHRGILLFRSIAGGHEFEFPELCAKKMYCRIVPIGEIKTKTTNCIAVQYVSNLEYDSPQPIENIANAMLLLDPNGKLLHQREYYVFGFEQYKDIIKTFLKEA